jgi:RecG-like helicase
MDLQAPVQYVKGIGPQKAEALGKAGVFSAEDLLLHLPLRYEDRRSFARVADLRPGMRVSVAGEITVAGLRRARRMAIHEAVLSSGNVMGAAVGGMVYHSYTISHLYWLAALILAAAALANLPLFLWANSRDRAEAGPESERPFG